MGNVLGNLGGLWVHNKGAIFFRPGEVWPQRQATTEPNVLMVDFILRSVGRVKYRWIMDHELLL